MPVFPLTPFHYAILKDECWELFLFRRNFLFTKVLIIMQGTASNWYLCRRATAYSVAIIYPGKDLHT